MSKTRVFIYGSCVSRDTFEHFDPEQFELIQYVARQSALSAYTRPVNLINPPELNSEFQQRMVSGDFASSLQQLIPQAATQTDLVLVDLTDERLGAYVLPDGSVVTRSMELIQSGAENSLPAGSQHLPFGSEQHFQYWSQGIKAVGDLIHNHMPRAGVALLDVPWAGVSETGESTPDSFGVTARDANPIFAAYIRVATEALGARVVSIDSQDVTSSPNHPWGEAPFHYSESVYLDLVHKLTGTTGRKVWDSDQRTTPGVGLAGGESAVRADLGEGRPARATSPTLSSAGVLHGGPNFLIGGAQHGGAEWLARQLAQHPEIFLASGKGTGYFNRPARLKSAEETDLYIQAFSDGRSHRWRGECTPDYFWHSKGGPFAPKRPNTAQQIAKYLAIDAPIILVLRDPVSRAVAAYWHYFSLGRFNLPTGIFQLPRELGIVDLGFYARHYRQWDRSLGADRIATILYEDILADPQLAVQQALNSLGLERDAIRVSATPTSSTAPKPWVRAFQKKGAITAQEIAALHELYREDIKRLEDILGRDLSGWKDRGALIRKHASPQSPPS